MDSINFSTTGPASPAHQNSTIASSRTVGETIVYSGGMSTEACQPSPQHGLITEVFLEPAELVEAAERPMSLRLVATGWSKNGRYYSPELLQRRQNLWHEGTKMYLEHSDPDIRSLAAVLVRDSFYDEHGRWGPGIYGEAQVMPEFREFLKNRQNAAGTSIRARGQWVAGTAEGRKGDIVTDLTVGETVDFVAEPAAGGRYTILESIQRTMTTEPTDALRAMQEEVASLKAENTALSEALHQATDQITSLRQTVATHTATAHIAERLGGTALPEAATTRIQTALLESLPISEGQLDVAALDAAIDARVGDMTELIEALNRPGTPPAPTVSGMGPMTESASMTLLRAFAESFRRQGMTPDEADRMAEIAAREA